MKIEFKIFNPEVVDCSTGYVNIVPDKSSLKLLIDMVNTIIESDFIKSIGSFTIRFQGNVGPLVGYKSPHVCEDYGFKKKYYESYGISPEDIQKQVSVESGQDKTFGLYTESFESAQRREEEEGAFIVPSGLSGLKEGLQVVSNIIVNDFQKYPPHISQKVDKIVFLSVSIEIGFVEGTLFMERIVVDSRRSVISIIFNSDGLPVPEEEYDTHAFYFIGSNLDKIFKERWSSDYKLDYVWGDDDLELSKDALKALDKKHKLNEAEYFIDSWDLPILKEFIAHDNKTDNVVAIYNTVEVPNELWCIVNSLENIPSIKTFGVRIIPLEEVDVNSLEDKRLLYGTHLPSQSEPHNLGKYKKLDDFF